MRNNPKKITCAIDLFYRGVSIRKVQYPYELACPELKLKSNNKWLELIQLSKKEENLSKSNTN